MLLLFSHVLGFLSLLIGGVYDLKTTEVPDWASIMGVAGGITLHAVYSYSTGSLEPLMWSLAVGAVFSIYGWGMYYYGMWGGADAFAMSVLGFAAPHGLSGQNLMYPVNLFVNLMIVGFVYTLVYAAYKAAISGNVLLDTRQRILEQESRISLEIVVAALFSALADIYLGVNGPIYFGFLLTMIFLYRFLRVLESSEMVRKMPVSELEVGDVIDQEGVEMGGVRGKNLVGNVLDRLKSFTGRDSGLLNHLEDRYGYSHIVGITEQEIEKLERSDVDEVEVKTGVRFVPVFPAALLITDVLGGGIYFLTMLVS